MYAALWNKQRHEMAAVDVTAMAPNKTTLNFYDKDLDEEGALIYIVVVIGKYKTEYSVLYLYSLAVCGKEGNRQSLLIKPCGDH